MEIAIKSECDSRVFIYPLLKCLHNYGTICLFSNNPYVRRLIDDEESQGFRDIVVIPVENGDLDAALDLDGYTTGKYDFTIFDNVGRIDYDILIAIVTNKITDGFRDDILYIIDEPSTQIIKFGKPGKAKKPAPTKVPKKKKGKNGEEPEEEVAEVDTSAKQEEEISASYNKWRIEKTDEDYFTDKISDKNAKWCSFPSYDAIERMESMHEFIVPDDNIVSEVYRLFGKYINIDERMFRKGVKVKDESSGNVSGTNLG